MNKLLTTIALALLGFFSGIITYIFIVPLNHSPYILLIFLFGFLFGLLISLFYYFSKKIGLGVVFGFTVISGVTFYLTTYFNFVTSLLLVATNSKSDLVLLFEHFPNFLQAFAFILFISIIFRVLLSPISNFSIIVVSIISTIVFFILDTTFRASYFELFIIWPAVMGGTLGLASSLVDGKKGKKTAKKTI